MTELPTHILRLADLPSRRATRFTLTPDASECSALAAALGVDALRRVRFDGTLAPSGRDDWGLSAALGATVQQPCVVTLAPVSTRIEDQITRRYLSDWQPPEGDEVQMPDDTETDPLPQQIDLYAVLREALSLALPAYPRSEGASLGQAQFTSPGQTPMSDADARPFAGLADLKNKLTET